MQNNVKQKEFRLQYLNIKSKLSTALFKAIAKDFSIGLVVGGGALFDSS